VSFSSISATFRRDAPASDFLGGTGHPLGEWGTQPALGRHRETSLLGDGNEIAEVS